MLLVVITSAWQPSTPRITARQTTTTMRRAIKSSEARYHLSAPDDDEARHQERRSTSPLITNNHAERNGSAAAVKRDIGLASRLWNSLKTETTLVLSADRWLGVWDLPRWSSRIRGRDRATSRRSVACRVFGQRGKLL